MTPPTRAKPASRRPANPGHRILLLKTAIWLTGLGPIAWLTVGFFRGTLGVLPVDTIILVEGRWTLVFLIATLAVTPIRRLTGWNRVIQVRRLLGLFAFFHACVHFLAYAGIDQVFAIGYIIEDVLDRRYITAGFAALVLLVPLAVTSTKGWIRRLGKRWRKLHRLAYLSASLGVLHFYWKVRADTFWPLVAALTLAGLFTVRLAYRKRSPKKTARK
ncbi:MAG: sulfoxide reductase heme-binding subunit YedZ [Gemmatimonadota bacterium]|nr:sulfoxide reductase heme-binding subunit YedZ [Gemmatimonadota bacterium]MDE2983211.1 sulfoxide reductase heme-binding subunit YedZ [Gemmatimonadota bacterium]